MLVLQLLHGVEFVIFARLFSLLILRPLGVRVIFLAWCLVNSLSGGKNKLLSHEPHISISQVI